jgi:hypothetical protein
MNTVNDTIHHQMVSQILDRLAAACGGYSCYDLHTLQCCLNGQLSQGLLHRMSPALVREATIDLETARWGECPEATEWVAKLQKLELSR